ncbi:hypothetical protein KAU15_00905 [candidate division WOR-3 bacterium]|nr:hypothetical protein [candidate division WOR-3 bacterium]
MTLRIQTEGTARRSPTKEKKENQEILDSRFFTQANLRHGNDRKKEGDSRVATTAEKKKKRNDGEERWID